MRVMKRVVLHHAQESMNKALSMAKGLFAFDFRWAKRRQAKLGTGAVLDANTHKIVDICR